MATKNKIPNLVNLMRVNNVSTVEIHQVVTQRGYYPLNTRIDMYDPYFVDDVLIKAWPEVLEAIRNNRHYKTIQSKKAG